MTKLIRIMLVAALVLGGLAGARAASADAEAESEVSVQQGGTSESGDAVGGQVVGIVSSGDASVDARNVSEDVDAESGDADATNDIPTLFVHVSATAATGDTEAGAGVEVGQTADASTGDAVGGQVIGVVTSAGGSADVVADNTSRDVDVETGDADATNDTGPTFVATAWASSTNGGDSDAELELGLEQSATASTGDGVGGQVIGVVSAGDASVDARNLSEEVDVETGDADAANEVETIFASVTAQSLNDGDANAEGTLEVAQAADASTGDGVGGQVIGVVTSAGGSADIVADNTSREVDVETGDADATNDIEHLHLVAAATATASSDAEAETELGVDQAATASTGDGVGGQVIGVVAAGDTSLDARNLTEDVDVETGDADATNDVGTLQVTSFASTSATGDADATLGFDLSQTADASSGDAVAGQVIGVVTSAGGSADAVLDSTARDSDAESGDSDFSNDEPFVGIHVNAHTQD